MMEPVQRVLVVDNDPVVCSSVQLLLETRGFEVLSASSVQEARAILSTEPIHLALLDIRLEDDTDPNDTSGLDLAEEMDPIVARIILTGYASYEHTRRALGHRIDTVPALDVISKKRPPSEWLGVVERAFREQLGINFDLQDDLLEGLSYADMAAELELDAEETEAETILWQLRELLRKLFAEAETVLVSPLGREGRTEGCSHSGATLIKVIPRYRSRGWGAAVVAKLGPRSQIKQESLNYEQHVRGFIGGHRHTSKEKSAYTLHLGGVVYSLIGTSLDDVWDLSAFYQHHPPEEIVQVLQNLFARTCQHWYENKQGKENYSITALYSSQLNLSLEKIEMAMMDVFPECAGRSTLEFSKIDRPLPNPVHWIWERNLHALTHLCTTHGDVHGGNVFVDANRQCWLIDFARTGEGHILRDFIELETDIKFSLLPETPWHTLYEFELALASPRRFGEASELSCPFAQEELNKAFEVIKALRRLAHDVVKPSDDMYEYYCGLLYQTLNIVRLRKISPFHKRHALLSAALICERLGNWRKTWPLPRPTSEDVDRIQSLLQQRRTQQSNLNKLEAKMAHYGLQVPLKLQNEYDLIKKRIVEIDRELARFENRGPKAPSSN
jgi:CheY-like chemotaxis protein